MIRITIEGLDELLLKVFGGALPSAVHAPTASEPAAPAAAPKAGRPKKTDTAATPDPIAAAQAATAPAPAAPAGGPTIDDVRAVIVKASAQGKLGAARTVEVIQETCGCKKASEIPADQYGNVIAALQAQLDLMD